MRIWRCQTFILFRQNPFLIKLFCEKLSNKTHLRVHHHNFQYSSSPGTLWLMILILHHMRHQAPGPLLSPRRSHPKLDIMTKWLNAPPLWNVFIAITTPSAVPSQVWIFKQHLIHSSHSSPTPHPLHFIRPAPVRKRCSFVQFWLQSQLHNLLARVNSAEYCHNQHLVHFISLHFWCPI